MQLEGTQHHSAGTVKGQRPHGRGEDVKQLRLGGTLGHEALHEFGDVATKAEGAQVLAEVHQAGVDVELGEQHQLRPCTAFPGRLCEGGCLQAWEALARRARAARKGRDPSGVASEAAHDGVVVAEGDHADDDDVVAVDFAVRCHASAAAGDAVADGIWPQ